jgi:hypothetical protein
MAAAPPPDPTCVAAHAHAQKHRAELLASTTCGCYFCFRQFPATAVAHWIDGNQTALCPSCGIDAVLGSSSGFVITDHFLRKMHRTFFAPHQKSRTP